MSRKEVGIEDARKNLGDLVIAAQQGADIVLTRRGKPAARIIAYREETAVTITLTPTQRAFLEAAAAGRAFRDSNPPYKTFIQGHDTAIRQTILDVVHTQQQLVQLNHDNRNRFGEILYVVTEAGRDVLNA